MNEYYEPGHSAVLPTATPAVPQAAPAAPVGVLSTGEAAQSGEAALDTVQTGVTNASHWVISDAAFAEALVQDTTPPGDLAAYSFPYDGTPLDAEAMTQDAEMRQWLADAQIPVETGGSIANALDAYARRSEGFSEIDHQIEAERTAEILQRTWGDRTPAMLEGARRLIRELDRKHGGRVREFLDSTGAGNDARLILELAHHAERLAARNGRR